MPSVTYYEGSGTSATPNIQFYQNRTYQNNLASGLRPGQVVQIFGEEYRIVEMSSDTGPYGEPIRGTLTLEKVGYQFHHYDTDMDTQEGDSVAGEVQVTLTEADIAAWRDGNRDWVTQKIDLLVGEAPAELEVGMVVEYDSGHQYRVAAISQEHAELIWTRMAGNSRGPRGENIVTSLDKVRRQMDEGKCWVVDPEEEGTDA